MADIKITQLPVEVLNQQDSSAVIRLSQLPVEILAKLSASTEVYDFQSLVTDNRGCEGQEDFSITLLRVDATPKVRITQLAVEVLQKYVPE
jgi:hypothetical protein